jgi:hypothetical protein
MSCVCSAHVRVALDQSATQRVAAYGCISPRWELAGRAREASPDARSPRCRSRVGPGQHRSRNARSMEEASRRQARRGCSLGPPRAHLGHGILHLYGRDRRLAAAGLQSREGPWSLHKSHFLMMIADREHVLNEYLEEEWARTSYQRFRGFSGHVQATPRVPSICWSLMKSNSWGAGNTVVDGWEAAVAKSEVSREGPAHLGRTRK